MAGRSGGTPIRTRKVTPGYDQAFTLPKGTSAAPIKQVVAKKFPKPTKESTVAKDAAVAAAIAIPVAARVTDTDVKVIKKIKKIFKKPKSDLGSDQTRRGYPHE